MHAEGFACFDTPIGTCGLAWSSTAVAGVALPDRSAAACRARLMRKFPYAVETAPPAHAAAAIQAICAHLGGEPNDLRCIDLDMSGLEPFQQRVYALARRIPPGHTMTYGEMATRLGAPGSARAVGQALGRNPFPIVVPCHRVLAAGGAMGGFSAPGGLDTKRRLLEIEGLRLDGPQGHLGFD